MKLFKRISLIVLSIAIVILIPLLLDWFVFRNSLKKSDWANFLGGYIGSIVSIIGVLFTVYFSNKKINEQIEKTNEQIALQKQEIEEQKRSQKEQYRLNNLPILDVKISKILEEPEDNPFNFSLVKYETFENENIIQKTMNANLCISNIGMGAAVDLKFACNSEYFNENGISWNGAIRTIKPNKEITQCFSFLYPQLNFVPEKKTARDYKFDLIIYYKDILGNSYAKTTKLSFFTENYVTEDENIISKWFKIDEEDLGRLEENPIDKIRKEIQNN